MAYGRAYAFFDCRASHDHIASMLPSIRDLAQTPSDLEITLIEGIEKLRCDGELREIAAQAKEEGMRYVIEACHPNAENRTVADEVADVMNQAYQSELYQPDEPFCGGVVFQEGDDYQFRE